MAAKRAEKKSVSEAPASDTAQGGLSRQSTFSTVRENVDLPEQNPPAGSHVIEELGKPSKSVS